jgi:hypothetical protein
MKIYSGESKYGVPIKVCQLAIVFVKIGQFAFSDILQLIQSPKEVCSNPEYKRILILVTCIKLQY